LHKSRKTTAKNIEGITELLVEQYLPRVLRYISHWVNNTGLAEELTIETLKQALARYKDCVNNEDIFSVRVFVIARQEIQDHLQIRSFKPSLPNLAHQEQEVLSLRLSAEMGTSGIARILGLPESSIRSIIFQSLSKLTAKREVTA
jgi:DNA-directed RNA polymerase specialized sigma24 family protein